VLECRSQWRIIVVTRFVRAARRPYRRHARHKEIRRAEQQDVHGVRLIEKLMVVVAKFDVPQIGHAEGRSRDGLPKLAQRINATLRRIAGYNRRIDGANRDSGNPIGMQIRLGQRLINARLIGAERAATL
jgi:hypothetical protein